MTRVPKKQTVIIEILHLEINWTILLLFYLSSHHSFQTSTVLSFLVFSFGQVESLEIFIFIAFHCK